MIAHIAHELVVAYLATFVVNVGPLLYRSIREGNIG